MWTRVDPGQVYSTRAPGIGGATNSQQVAEQYWPLLTLSWHGPMHFRGCVLLKTKPRCRRRDFRSTLSNSPIPTRVNMTTLLRGSAFITGAASGKCGCLLRTPRCPNSGPRVPGRTCAVRYPCYPADQGYFRHNPHSDPPHLIITC